MFRGEAEGNIDSRGSTKHTAFPSQAKQTLNELWTFTVDAHALFTHFNVDRSKNVLMLTGCPVAIAID